MTEKCSIHYHACECREAKFARVIEAAKEVYSGNLGYILDLMVAVQEFEGKK